jgi:hypothetical protein
MSVQKGVFAYPEDLTLDANAELGDRRACDAGKTSLTERLLYAVGVIDEIGSVDAGSTQTDSWRWNDNAASPSSPPWCPSSSTTSRST